MLRIDSRTTEHTDAERVVIAWHNSLIHTYGISEAVDIIKGQIKDFGPCVLSEVFADAEFEEFLRD
jgi:3-oxoacyl-ACP reductase-like protein